MAAIAEAPQRRRHGSDQNFWRLVYSASSHFTHSPVVREPVLHERSLMGSGEKLYQYDIRHDLFEKDDQFIIKQIGTHLRERFHVLQSVVEYEIVDGHLVRPGTTKPFIDSIKIGRDTIQRIMPIASDFTREDAEVDAFGQVIDPFLASPRTPEGSIVFSISLRGGEDSKYKHNFYDIFTKRKRLGKFYVELSRYSSGLTSGEYAEKFGLDPQNPPTAAEWLSAPFTSTNVSITAEDIHRELHKDHDYMSTEFFEEKIWRSVALRGCIVDYIFNRDAKSFNRMLNVADEIEENERRKERGEVYVDYMDRMLTRDERDRFAAQPVKQRAGDCPGESGAEDENTFWSVTDSGVGEIEILECHCGFCGKLVKAVIANGRIYCPPADDGGCGRSAPYKC